ncbi:MAG: hypothetical protein HND57_02130 [Planctomycetes bacterium]|nr:hypothetical protein [Planctomycetota bacterium]
MSFVLQSCELGVEFIASEPVWQAILLLARQFGWVAEGTLRADHSMAGCGAGAVRKSSSGTQAEQSVAVADYEPERFGYDRHESLWVTPEDADALADAVERATPEVPQCPVESAPGVVPNPIDCVAGRAETLHEFVAFCRHGPFRIT